MFSRLASAVLVVGAFFLFACSDSGPGRTSRSATSSPDTPSDGPPSNAKQTAAAITPPDGEALYGQHCAPCHGITGDGQGTMELDVPARSFQEGKFSFGNTRDAMFKTVTSGIPGRSPMPGFAALLSEEERRAVVERVIELLPTPPDEAHAQGAELVVLGDSLFARGLLEPVVKDGPRYPRALALGRPEGLSFFYRADDMRLLQVRLGKFMERSDWKGRGGNSMRPLGRVLLDIQGGDPDPSFWMLGEPMAARLTATWVREDESGIDLVLVQQPEGAASFAVTELVEVVACAEGTGFRRTWSSTQEGLDIASLDPAGAPAESAIWSESDGWSWRHRPLAEGMIEVIAVRGKRAGEGPHGRPLFQPIVEDEMRSWSVLTLVANDWDEQRREAVLEAMQ